MITTTTEKTLKDLILNAIKNRNHTLRDFGSISEFDVYSTGEIIQELEVLEGIYIHKIEPPAAPFISWWLTKPKGRIVYNEEGKLVEKELKPKSKPVIPLQIKVLDQEHNYKNAGEFVEIPVTKLIHHPNNPRISVNKSEQKFADLVQSILEHGIQQPLVVQKLNQDFRIIIGHRRFEAAKEIGLQNVPCIIREFAEGEEEPVMLIENIQRKDLTPIQEAKAFKRRYIALDKDINAVARELGLTQSYIKNKLMLLKLDTEIQKLVDARKLGLSQALQLTRLEIPKQNKLLGKALRLKASKLKVVVDRELVGSGAPPKWRIPKQILSETEVFDRNWAIKELDKAGETYFTAKYFRNAFDDICQDSCEPSVCASCPAPRMIAAMLRHHQRGEGNV